MPVFCPQIKAIPGFDKAKAAADKVHKAQAALHAALEKANKSLKISPEGKLVAADPAGQPPAEAAAFNTAIDELKAAVGAEFKVGVSVVPAGAAGAPTVRVKYGKPTFKAPSDTTFTLTPIHVLDIAATAQVRYTLPPPP